MSRILDLDRRHAWHPYTQHATEIDPIVISRAQGASLFDEDGREILDLISSWWTCTHGHAHKEINKALCAQADRFEHVMFAGFTHPPAAELAARIAQVLPGSLNRVFYSDNGSTAVEVALKLAYQYWRNRHEDQRRLFLAFDGGYHGDTFGAMAVGRGSGFFSLFEDLMFEVTSLPYPECWIGDDEVAAKEAASLEALDMVLKEDGAKIAGLIVEPLVQGAGGMRMCRPEFLRAMVELVQAAGIPVIFDEVATGFGRTGTLFALEQAGVVPDVVCLSKGLTSGYMPMSVTVVRDEIFDAFLGDDFSRALAHGHSFTANPLACAVALRSLELFEEEKTLDKIAAISAQHQHFLESQCGHGKIERLRCVGSIMAFDLADGADGYKSEAGEFLRAYFLENGLNIRPLGSTIYLMPPYCVAEDELARAYAGIVDGLKAVAEMSGRTPRW